MLSTPGASRVLILSLCPLPIKTIAQHLSSSAGSVPHRRVGSRCPCKQTPRSLTHRSKTHDFFQPRKSGSVASRRCECDVRSLSVVGAQNLYRGCPADLYSCVIRSTSARFRIATMREGSLRPLTESYDSIAGEHEPFRHICKVETTERERRGGKVPNGWKGENLGAIE